jgi:outer membrane lipoprotein-sorting protein
MAVAKKFKLLSCLAIIAGLTITSAYAQDAEQKGLEIAKERKARDLGWGDSVASMSMILRNAQGKKSERKIRSKTLEVADDGDKGLTIFDQPRDVKGTAFLSFSHATVPDDQWMYLPALKRVKRIASRNKSGPFMGSEFAFEDMSSFEIEKYTYKYLGDEKLNNTSMFVVEHFPVDKNSGYTRQKVWVDKDHYRVHKVEFYDRKNSLLKTLKMEKYQLYLDKYWRPMRAEMYNHQNGKSTELITHDLAFNNGLKETDFNESTLKRAR